MIKEGDQVVCDRCGIVRFVESIDKLEEEGWLIFKRQNRAYCPHCAALRAYAYNCPYRDCENRYELCWKCKDMSCYRDE